MFQNHCLLLFFRIIVVFILTYKIDLFSVRVGEYNVLDENETHDHANRRITRVITHVNFDKVHTHYLHGLKIFSKFV